MDWLETEKRVVVIHRLHQILEPFMLRRQVRGAQGWVHGWAGCVRVRQDSAQLRRCALPVSAAHPSHIPLHIPGPHPCSQRAPLRQPTAHHALTHTAPTHSPTLPHPHQVEDVESKLPPKVPVVVKVAMSPYQSCIYQWVKASGTIRLDPTAPFLGKFRREFASLNNKCMELRKVGGRVAGGIRVCVCVLGLGGRGVLHREACTCMHAAALLPHQCTHPAVH